METKLDFEGLAAALLARGAEFCNSWLPGGRIVGREYVCGDIRGGPGDSLKVNLNTGKWADFAADIRGGDLISLYAATENIKNGDAAKRLSDQIGFLLKSQPVSRPMTVEHSIIRPPAEVSPPTMDHPKFGKPSSSWIYRDQAGEILFYVGRYESGEGKQFFPWAWSGTAKRWVSKAWPAPRPLYGLELLKTRPNAPIMIVEGEKAVEAARSMVGGTYLVVCWPNGAKAYDKADWQPIYGRKVLIWPDADSPGVAAADKIVEILKPHCPEIKVIDTNGQPDGWDAADALANGWNFETLVDWAKPRAIIVAQAVATAETPAATVTAAAQVNVTINTEEALICSEDAQMIWERLGLTVSGKQGPNINFDNVQRILENEDNLKGIIWFDEFHQKYFTRWGVAPGDEPREWSDIDEIKLSLYMQRNLGLAKMGDEVIHKACREYARRHTRNEPKDWMETLVWDKKERIGYMFADAFGADVGSPYVFAASKNLWIGMVARIYRPGCQLDTMVILEGAQGMGKTNALRIIGGKWYASGQESVSNKDFFMVLHGKLIIEIAELDAFRKVELTRIKQIVTCTTDRYRAPYGRAAEDHPRMSVFIGTTNETVYLGDSTGGRRFWPIKCEKIDLEWIAANREQLFAEAVHKFKAGENWYEMPETETKIEQEKRRHQDEWAGIMSEYLYLKEETTIKDVAVDCLKIEVGKIDHKLTMRIGGLLRNLGWGKKVVVEKEGKGANVVWVRQEN